MEIYQILIISIPYILLGGLSAFSGEVSRTPREMRPPVFHSEVLEFGLSLYWGLMIIASIIIFFVMNFTFLIVLLVVSIILSPLTGKLGRKIYYSLVAIPLYEYTEKEKSPNPLLLWGRLLFLPILFFGWMIYIIFI